MFKKKLAKWNKKDVHEIFALIEKNEVNGFKNNNTQSDNSLNN